MLGLLMYGQDYDEKLPTYYWGEGYNNQANSCTWWGGIYPYVKNVQIFACPSSSSTSHNTWGVWANFAYGGIFANAAINYGYNELIGNQAALPLSRLSRPAETLVLGDCTSTWIGGYWSASWPDRALLRRVAFASGGAPCGCPPAALGTIDEAWCVHNGGSNLGFADGHVKWSKWSNVKTVTGGGPLLYYDTEW
jgi:prepilin-type processing-associated H-X9-DG protein